LTVKPDPKVSFQRCGSNSGATVVDAIVMASAAAAGNVVYTSDFADLSRQRDRHFRGVRVLAL
jgi:hypothetical protein